MNTINSPKTAGGNYSKIERAILSSLIFYYPKVSETHHIEDLNEDLFITMEAKKVFQAISNSDLVEKNYDLVLVSNCLKALCTQNEYPLAAIFLASLEPEVQYLGFSRHLQLLTHHSTKLRIDVLCQSILSSPVDQDFSQHLESWETNFISLTRETDSSHYLHSADLVEEYDLLIEQSRDIQISPLKTGFSFLDKKIKGFMGGQLIVLAARPGVGKTTLALNMIWHNIDNPSNDQCIGVFSLEMINISLLEKLISIDSAISLDVVKNSLDGERQSELDGSMIEESKKKIGKSNIFFYKETNVTIEKISSTIKTWVREKNLKLVVIDYLQLISHGTMRDQNLSQYQKIGMITRKLKLLSIDLNICILSLAQLNRKFEDRKVSNKAPILSDLRESGSIEQDADIVLFLYDDNPQEDDDDSSEEVENSDFSNLSLKIGKNRHGGVGTMRLQFKKDNGRFKDGFDSGGGFY